MVAITKSGRKDGGAWEEVFTMGGRRTSKRATPGRGVAAVSWLTPRRKPKPKRAREMRWRSSIMVTRMATLVDAAKGSFVPSCGGL